MSKLKKANHLKIPLEDIKRATKNFQVCIGKGGYGMVYKGELIISGRPTTAAIKRLYEKSGQGLKEFLTEIELLSGQNHPNLIRLVGYCDEEKEKIIVYEYAERASLDVYLRGDTDSTLTWLQRLKICIDAARGLAYLHNHVGDHQAIIHRDIKSSNILIDENWVAKLSDLGLSKLGLAGLNRSDVVTRPCGTYGYCEPEYIDTCVVTKESDIFSFGIVLFEVLCGRLCTNIKGDNGVFISPRSAKDYYLNNTLDKIVDPSLKDEMKVYSLNRFAAIAKRCLHDDRGERPPMHLVVKELEESLELQKSQRLRPKLHVLHVYPQQTLEYDTSSIIFQHEKVVAEIKAARRAVKAHKLGEPTLITCDRHSAWGIFNHFDLDKDGVLNRGELEAFIRATHPGIDTLAREIDRFISHNTSLGYDREILTSNCVYNFYNLYEGYIDDEKGLTFDGFLLSTHTIKFDLDLAIRRFRLDMYLLENRLIAALVTCIILSLIGKICMEKLYTAQALRPLGYTFLKFMYWALLATGILLLF